jgi:Zn-finger nucleic acid-binding protein
MNCPKCTGDLVPIETGELVEVDFCGACKGIFFDPGEAGIWLEMASDLPQLEASLGQARATDLSCPKCGEGFQELPHAGGSNLLLDRCQGCHGIWFDAAEIPKAEAIAAALSDPVSKVMRALKLLNAKGYRVMKVTAR